jgi:hypothetical protein
LAREKGDEGFLTPIRREVTRKKFLVCDVESKSDDSQEAGFTRPFMVGVFGGSNYVPFRDQNRGKHHWSEGYWREGGCVDLAMRAMLSNRYRGYHVYAHNAGRFDYLFFLPWLMTIGRELGFSFSVMPVASSIQVLDVWRGDNTKESRIRFLDSFKLIPTGLDKAAKSFGLAGKKAHDLNLPEDHEDWPVYNGQDCTELYGVLDKFHHYVENVLGGEVGITAPATSVKLYRRKYLTQKLPRSMDTHDFVRSSYCGGRVEPYHRRGENLRYYDFNSSYPFAMLSDMPAGRATWWEGRPPKKLLDQIGFVEAEVVVPDMKIPPLPVKVDRATRDRTGLPEGKLIFPTGRLKGVWEYDELKTAVEFGAEIVSWKRSVWYERVQMFKEFVLDLYKYRDKSSSSYDEGLAEVVKIMLNSAYGKFGMNTRRRKIYLWDDPELPANATPASGHPDSTVWYAEEEVDAAYIMPQVAARVTALARVHLFRGMQRALAKGGEVYYCDTDSIITDAELPWSTKLGDLKDEFPEYSGRLQGEFLGPKMYVIKYDGELGFFQKVKAKGMQSRTKFVVDCLKDGLSIPQKRLEKVGSLARAGFSRGPRMIDAPKRLLAEKGKRVMHEDGSSSPYRLEMW